MNSNAKHLIAFDNIERFIGVDEIFNSQIDSFVEHLRHISDAYLGQDKDFLKRFQFVILMRNTSSRMHNAPLQSIDFGGHELDLSDWFPVDLIISKKVDWYKNCGFSIKHGEIINSVIGENSFDGHGIRSLYEKLGSILNRDKRIIVNMLDRAISYSASANPVILSRFSEFLELEKKDTMPQGLTRFAARSIIMRIVLDVFREDNFFKLIRTQEKGTKNERLGYSRKILTVLYEFHLEYPQTAYMRFDDLIRKIIGNTYFDENNAYLRNTISSILFTMNYYNRRTNDWFRLIDIQHNLKSPGSETISDAAELNTLLSKHPDEVGLRIMEAGIGYLWYLVQSFEYFSCRYNNNNEYLPPLLCCIPSLNDLETKSVEQLECFNVITKVQDEAINCIEYMRKNENTDLLFKKRAGAKGMSHIQRIINSHTGYMGNFMEFVKQYYKQSELSPNQKATLDHLERKIGWVKEGYYKYSTQRPNRENSARH